MHGSARCVKGSWNVIALTEYEDGPGTAGQIAERYAYTPYGEFVVLTGAGTAERGQVRPALPRVWRSDLSIDQIRVYSILHSVLSCVSDRRRNRGEEE